MRLAAIVLVVCSLASAARAQPGQTPPAPPAPYSYQPPPQPQPATRTERYGTTIALVDGLSMAAVVIGAVIFVGSVVEDDDSSGSDGALGAAIMIGGGVSMFVGGPYVHYRKGNSSGAWQSLGLRIGLPLVGSLIGVAMQDECADNGEPCDDETGGSLGGIGFLAAMAIEGFVLAKREVAVTYAYPTPYVAPAPGGGLTLGLGGRF
jgi:hypothetical protein